MADTPKVATLEDLRALAQIFDARLAEMDVTILNLSQALAEKDHGEDTVKSACEWAGPRLQTFAAYRHPYEALVQTYKASGSH